VIVPVACPMPGRTSGTPALFGSMIVHLQPHSQARAIYGRDAITAHHYCSFEVNPVYERTFAQSGLVTSGTGPRGETRLVELPSHRFYVASLYQPQRSSRPDAPDPLVTAFVSAAHCFRRKHVADGDRS
jgi:CTP synthase (UTP-ammonia lyase)